MNTIEPYAEIREIMSLYPELTDFFMELGLCGCDYGRKSSLSLTLEHVSKEKGIPLQELLDELNIELVLTAHPTEAKRRSIRLKLRRLRELLHQRDDPSTQGRGLDA